MQEHIIKMYDNISKLQFQEGVNNEWVVTGMISAEGEVKLNKKCFTKSLLCLGKVPMKTCFSKTVSYYFENLWEIVLVPFGEAVSVLKTFLVFLLKAFCLQLL